MTLAQSKSPRRRLARAIVQRTRGRTHGPVTRLMSPSDLGEILKPFVFLDLFDHDGAPEFPTRVIDYISLKKLWISVANHTGTSCIG
jgi:hypothetical protein